MTQTQPQDQLGGTPLQGDPLIGDKLTALPGLDLAAMDQKIQRMHTIDQTWDLPSIPDHTKLDLAMQTGTDHQSISDFLYGVWHDVGAAVAPVNPLSASPASALAVTSAPDRAATDQPAVNQSFDEDPNSTSNNLRKYWAGWAGLRAPAIVDPNSVNAFKEQAIQRGLLPDPGPDGTIDGTWTPDMRSIQAQMLNQDFSSRLGGNRPGAVSDNQLVGAVTKWMTPSGLIGAATKLDLLPDVGSLAHRWGNFIKHPGAHTLINAIGDTVDHAIIPVVNDFLLLNGVSEAMLFARGAELVDGAEAARGMFGTAESIRNSQIGRLANLGKAYDPIAEAKAFSEPSFLSKVVSHVPGVGETASEGMQAWRDWSGSQMAKKAVQTGMKLGIASNLEHLITPDSKKGTLGDIGNAITMHQYTKTIATNPITHGLQMVMDNAFAPSTLFGRGAVTDVAAGFTDAAKNKLIGVTANQRLTATIASAMHDKLVLEAANTDDPVIKDLASRVTAAWQKAGPSAAWVEYNGGNEEHAGAVATYLSAVAGLGSMAATKAARAGIDSKFSDSAGFRSQTQFYLNKGIAQLQHIDPEDMASYAGARAWGESANYKQVLKNTQKYLDAVQTPEGREEASKLIEWHQATRNGFWNDLLENHVNEGSLQTVLDDAWPTIGNWDKFTNAAHEITMARASGALGTDVRLLPAKSQLGRNLVENEVELTSSATPRTIGGLYPETGDLNLQRQLAPPRADDYVQRALTPLATPINPDLTSMTASALNTPTKQDALALAHYSKWLLSRRQILNDFEGASGARLTANFVAPLQQKAADAGQALHDVRPSIMNAWVDEIATNAKVGKNAAKRYAGITRWASENGITDLGDLKTKLDADISAVSGSSIWSDRFGVGRNLTVDAGEHLLNAQVRELRKAANWMAAEVDTSANPELAALGERLGNQGYKLVHGVKFIQPHDVADLDGTFADVTERTMHRLTLGAFIDRQEPASMKALRDRATRSELAGELTKVAKAGNLKTPAGQTVANALHPDSPELDQVLDLLHGHLKSMQDIRAQDVADAYQSRGMTGRLLARAANRGLPYTIHDMNFKQVEGAIGPVLGDHAVAAVHQALLNAKKAGGFKLNGLTQIENNLRAHDNVSGVLQVLGRTPIGHAIDEFKAAETKGKKAMAIAHGAAGSLFTPSAIAGGTIGAGLAAANTGGNPQATLAGGVGGAIAVPALKAKGFGWLAGKESAALAAHPTWQRYTHLADGLAHVRDELRFHLNPFFDLRRYTKGYALSLMHDMPEGVDPTANMSIGSFVKKYGPEETNRMRGAFKDIATGQFGGFNPDAIEDVSKAWAQEGLLGYNPTEHMVGMFGHLVKGGVDPEQAFKTAKDVYSYGTSGRSALEQSVNMIFFPFSFEKKLMKTAGKFISSDLSRAQMLHDGLQAYQTLDDRYDLSNYWQEHLPVLSQLEKVNAFAHGLSPGELGGINRPLIEAGLAMLGKGAEHAPFLNAFIPQGVNITNHDQGQTLIHLMARTLPIRNDMGRLLDDLKSQGHVMFSPGHLTEDAETQHGWTEANTLKDEVDQAAITHGHRKGIASVMAAQPGDSLYALKQAYEQKRLAINDKFPAWGKSIDSAIARRLTDERELKMRVTGIEERAATGKPPKPGDYGLATFAQYDDALHKKLTSHGVSIEDHPELVPGEIYQSVREMAVELAQKDPGFLNEYKRYFARTWGPIQRDLT